MYRGIKLCIYGFFVLTLLQICNAIYAQSEKIGKGYVLKGTVEDAKTSKALAGVTLKIVELGRTVKTGKNGSFVFKYLPSGNFTLGIHLKGYASEHFSVSVPLGTDLLVMLQPGFHYQEEVTVTAAPQVEKITENPKQLDIVDSEDVRINAKASLGSAVEHIPGVRNSSTGDVDGKPVIRGVTGNRILVLNDGIAMNDQQFSIRHQPNIEILDAERIEIVRGPESVLYGSGAIGGVINIVDAPLPSTENGKEEYHGEIIGLFSENNDEGMGHIVMEGAKGGFGWRTTYTRRSAGDMSSPDQVLQNTDYTQNSASLATGYTGSWGKVRVRWKHWDNNFGFFRPKGFRVNLNDDLIAFDAYLPTSKGDFDIISSHERNHRKVYPPYMEGKPSVNLDLNTDNFQFKFHHLPIGPIKGVIALQCGKQVNDARALGNILPDYKSHSWAVFLYEQVRFHGNGYQKFDRWILSGAVRYDGKNVDVDPGVVQNLPHGFNNTWNSVTASSGVLYRLTKNLSAAFNFGKGWRVPSEFELFVHGIHGGVNAVQIGNPNLKDETSLNTECSLKWTYSITRGYLTFYNNSFNNYIYLADSGETEETPSGTLPVFMEKQTDAIIRGIEGKIDVSPFDWVNIEFNFDHIHTKNKTTGHKLPFKAPDRQSGLLKFEHGKFYKFSSEYFSLEVIHNNHGDISGTDEPFGTPTEAYTVSNMAIGGSTVLSKDLVLGIDFTVKNLFNKKYKDFLYTYKPWAYNPGRDAKIQVRFIF